MRLQWLILAAGLALTLGLPARASEELSKKAGCSGCHSVDKKRMAPSYKDLAVRYRGDPEAEAKVVANLTKPGAHPAVKADKEELKALVRYILAQ